MFLIVTLSFDLSKEWKHLEEKIGPGLLRECCRLVTRLESFISSAYPGVVSRKIA
jgi:hypothetical protein